MGLFDEISDEEKLKILGGLGVGEQKPMWTSTNWEHPPEKPTEIAMSQGLPEWVSSLKSDEMRMPQESEATPTQVRKPVLGMTPKPIIAEDSAPALPPTSESTADEMNPAVKDYVMKKFGLGNYSDENRKAVEQSSEIGIGDRLAAALSALGAGFQGGDSAAAGQNSLKNARDVKRQKLDDFDKGRTNKLQENALSRDADKYGQAEELRLREKDPNSQESKMADDLARSMGYRGSQLTAEQFKNFSPIMQKRYEIEQRKLDRQEARQERRFQSGIKMDEKMQGLKTPFGLANNEDDAKKLKDGYESKKNFDNKIQEMIDLRSKNKGGASLNREDVARGKQLSKDLLLEYKNMAKLGVLSVSDEDILNKIIPEDPLEYNSPLASAQGQDPILSNLKKFKDDSNKDFATHIRTRVRNGEQASQKFSDDANKDGKTIQKTQTNKRTGQKRIVYSDGSYEDMPMSKMAGN